jgi:hypothetical protein
MSTSHQGAIKDGKLPRDLKFVETISSANVGKKSPTPMQITTAITEIVDARNELLGALNTFALGRSLVMRASTRRDTHELMEKVEKFIRLDCNKLGQDTFTAEDLVTFFVRFVGLSEEGALVLMSMVGLELKRVGLMLQNMLRNFLTSNIERVCVTGADALEPFKAVLPSFREGLPADAVVTAIMDHSEVFARLVDIPLCGYAAKIKHVFIEFSASMASANVGPGLDYATTFARNIYMCSSDDNIKFLQELFDEGDTNRDAISVFFQRTTFSSSMCDAQNIVHKT